MILFIGGYFGIKFYKEYQIQQRIKNCVKIVELSKDKIGYNEKITLNELISNINGDYPENQIIDTTKLGKQKIKFEYLHQEEQLMVPYEIEFEIVDLVPPTIYFNSPITITVGTDTNLINKLISFDDLDDNPQREIVGAYNLNAIGNYDLKFVITDNYGNESTKDFTLKVVKKSNSSSSGSVKTTPFKTYLNNYKKENTKIGIDVSKWQYDINFDKVKQEGVEFAIIKLGGTDGLDGEPYIDKYYEKNIEGFTKVGIPVGLYYFSHANTKEKAINEAKYLLENIKGYKIDLPIYFDWENFSNFNKYNMSRKTLNDVAKAFINTIKKAGYESMIYGSKNYLNNFWDVKEENVWLAHYTSNTDYDGKYNMWQLTSTCKISGITENTVDVDIMYLDK